MISFLKRSLITAALCGLGALFVNWHLELGTTGTLWVGAGLFAVASVLVQRYRKNAQAQFDESRRRMGAFAERLRLESVDKAKLRALGVRAELGWTGRLQSRVGGVQRAISPDGGEVVIGVNHEIVHGWVDLKFPFTLDPSLETLGLTMDEAESGHSEDDLAPTGDPEFDQQIDLALMSLDFSDERALPSVLSYATPARARAILLKLRSAIDDLEGYCSWDMSLESLELTISPHQGKRFWLEDKDLETIAGLAVDLALALAEPPQDLTERLAWIATHDPSEHFRTRARDHLLLYHPQSEQAEAFLEEALEASDPLIRLQAALQHPDRHPLQFEADLLAMSERPSKTGPERLYEDREIQHILHSALSSLLGWEGQLLPPRLIDGIMAKPLSPLRGVFLGLLPGGLAALDIDQRNTAVRHLLDRQQSDVIKTLLETIGDQGWLSCVPLLLDLRLPQNPAGRACAALYVRTLASLLPETEADGAEDWGHLGTQLEARILELLELDDAKEVELACIESLGQVGGVRSVEELAEFTDELTDERTRKRAARQALAAIRARLEGLGAAGGQLTMTREAEEQGRLSKVRSEGALSVKK